VSDEREQARGGSGEPPVPDAESKGAESPAQTSDELTPERERGAEGAEAAAHPGADRTAAVQVPEAHEAGGIPDDFRAEVEEIMGRYPQKRSASIPVLFAVQRRYGWCTPEGIRQGAAVMGVSAAYLESVASFYDLFHLEPAGRHRVLVCTNISCWMRGADGLLEAFCEAGGADPHEAGHGGTVTADGECFIQGFECLGACDMAPMVSIDERYYGPLEDADAAAALEALKAGAEVLPGKEMAKRPLAGGPEGEPDPRAANAG
jgi:NADH:ubiquinone oxidoreductase subunit E